MSVEHQLLPVDLDGIQTGEPILMLNGGHYRAQDDHLEQPGGHQLYQGFQPQFPGRHRNVDLAP